MMQPDIADALTEIVETLTAPEHVYTRLQHDFTDRLPAVLITADQNDGDLLAEHRAAFEIYHHDVADARLLTRTIVAHLTSGPHGTTAGLIDRIRIDVKPREVPYPNPDVCQFTFTVICETRPL